MDDLGYLPQGAEESEVLFTLIAERYERRSLGITSNLVFPQCAAEGVDHSQYLLRLAELELIDRHQRMVERRIRAARFPAVKSLDTFDFTAIPSVNKSLVMELARCEYVQHRENIIAVGNSGTGKTHVALGLGPGPPASGGCRWASPRPPPWSTS